MKAHRSVILGFALAILGAAACEDQTEVVVPPPPDPPLEITVTPASAEIEVNESTQFVASVTGGAAGGDKSVTWTSSAPTIASVAANGNVVTVTGVAPGTATVRAVATADASVIGAANVTVVDPGGVPPTISIESITASASNLPVNVNNVFGQVEVNINLDIPQGTVVSRVEVLANNVVIYEQGFSTPELGLGNADEAQSAVPISASWDTRDFDRTDIFANATGTIQGRYPNGTTTITAQVIGPQGTITATTSRQIVLNNTSFVYVRRTAPTGTNCVLSTAASVGFPISAPAGSQWCTGDIVFDAVGVDFSGNANNNVAQLTLTANGGTDPLTPDVAVDAATTAPFSMTLRDASSGATGDRINDWEWANVGFSMLGVTAGGQPLSGCVVTEAIPTPLNLACVTFNGAITLQNQLNEDNVAPALTVSTAITLPNGSNSWIGPNVTNTALGSGITAVDQGVGNVGIQLQYAPTPITSSSTFTTVADASGIPESTVNTAYGIRLRYCDGLMNCRNSDVATIGSDHTPPVNVAYTAGSPAANAIVRNSPTNPAPVDMTFTFALMGADALSGPFDTYGTVKRLNPSGSTTCVFGATSACLPVSNVDPSQGGVPFTVNASAAEGFYTFDGVFRDLARNSTPVLPRTVVSDATNPLVQNIILPSLLPSGGSAVHTATATDNLDLRDWRFHTIFSDGSELPAPPVAPLSTPASEGFTAFDGFGEPLIQSAALTSNADFIKSIEFTAAGVPTGTVNGAVGARFTVRDHALNSSTAFNNYAVGTVPVGTSATAIGVNLYVGQVVPTQPTVICDPNGPSAPCGTNPTSTTLEAVASGLSGAFNFPFNRVAFYRVDAGGQYHFIGETTARLSTDDGSGVNPTGRVWTYGPVTFAGDGFGGTVVNIVAVGVDTTGDGLISGAFAVTVN